MNYFVVRGDQQLGPYTLAELHQQVQTGSILPTDLAQSEGMSGYASVSEILGNIPIQAVSQNGAAVAPAMEPLFQIVPLPANLHWLALFVIETLTLGYFNFIWALYLANWARKLDGNNKALVLIAMYPSGFVAGAIAALQGQQAIGGLLNLGGLIAYLIGIFTIKAAMEAYYNFTENIGLQLSGAMTFFFSTIYFQYHINKIAKWKKIGT